MATAIEVEVRSILTPKREEKIDDAYTKAWDDWWKSKDRPKQSRWSRTRANNIFEYLTTHLLKEFADDSGAQFIFGRETFKLILDSRLVIRFKKTGHDGMGSNIGTQASFGFCDPQQGLPGMPGVQKIEIVYTLNVTQTALSKIIVLARDGKRKLWSYGIDSSLGGAQVLPMIQPKKPLTPLEDLVKERKKKTKMGDE